MINTKIYSLRQIDAGFKKTKILAYIINQQRLDKVFKLLFVNNSHISKLVIKFLNNVVYNIEKLSSLSSYKLTVYATTGKKIRRKLKSSRGSLNFAKKRKGNLFVIINEI